MFAYCIDGRAQAVGSQGSTERRTTAAARHAAGQWTMGGGWCSGRQHGQGHRAEDEHDAHTGARRERRLRKLRGKQRQRFWLQRLRGEARQTLGGKRPYLCSLSPLPATHPHMLLHARAPCGYHRPPSTPELHMALDMDPDGLLLISACGRIWQATT